MNDFFAEPEQQKLSNKLSDQQRVIYLNNDQIPAQYNQLNDEIEKYMPN
jgi:hypothetical protein